MSFFVGIISSRMNPKQKLYLSLLSGLLFIPAWYSWWGSGILLFIAFIPLLLIQEELLKTKKKSAAYFWLPYLSFFIWNLGTSWWIKNASFVGLIAALLINSLMMTLPFWLSSISHRKLGKRFGYFSLLFYWLAMEYFYLHAEISWTWFNLGNGFANDIKLIQWYEFTGTLGGTFWIISINLLLFKIFKGIRANQKFSTYKFELILSLLLVILPAGFSIFKFYTYTEEVNPYEIVIVQPNIDPYQKFNDIPKDKQMQILLDISDSLATAQTDYIVAPETFINNNVWLHNLELNSSIIQIKNFLKDYPQTEMVIGATTYQLYDSPLASPTARPFRGNKFYDSFNSAMQIDTGNNIPIYHKSELVVGVEKMPYIQYLGFLQKLTLKLGGTFRSHGTQEFRGSFTNPKDSLKVGPVICYESIFGEFVTEYVRDAKANFIFVITNDGWWGDTPGYIQHNSYSSLRAIENRRSIARSANTGISAFFDQRGEIHETLAWWERGGIKSTLNANSKMTFYTLHGDYFGRIAMALSVILLLYTVVIILIGSRKNLH